MRNKLACSSSTQQRTSLFCPLPSNASLNSTETLTLFLCTSRLCTLVFAPLLNTVHHPSLSVPLHPPHLRTVTAGWRPESNRASFLMMFPTPGMTAWSRRTSHSILLLWPLTASTEREKLNLGEHTSRHSVALTLCSLSSANLQGEARWQRQKSLVKNI